MEEATCKYVTPSASGKIFRHKLTLTGGRREGGKLMMIGHGVCLLTDYTVFTCSRSLHLAPAAVPGLFNFSVSCVTFLVEKHLEFVSVYEEDGSPASELAG